jgi:aminoglycoside/choline kinase family phosphotransferase
VIPAPRATGAGPLLDNRIVALKQWSARALGTDKFDVQPATADASFRRYFRISLGQQTFIVMDAPPDKNDMHAYVAIARRFHTLGLNVPEVLVEDHRLGFYLVTDLGDRVYLNNLHEQTVERLYGDAMEAMVLLQTGGLSATATRFLPDYDEALLWREMEIFREWYLERHLGINLSSCQQAVLDQTFVLLVSEALSQPRVWVHRDFHSRNLMVTAQNNPGILDFQDAVLGPVTYDLVSLLRDCYIRWPRDRVESWIRDYQMLARQSDIAVGGDDALFLRWFDLMGVQRHLKATGIFARLCHRDGKPGYLPDIPRTLGYVYEVSVRYPELQPFLTLMQELKLPGAD